MVWYDFYTKLSLPFFKGEKIETLVFGLKLSSIVSMIYHILMFILMTVANSYDRSTTALVTFLSWWSLMIGICSATLFSFIRKKSKTTSWIGYGLILLSLTEVVLSLFLLGNYVGPALLFFLGGMSGFYFGSAAIALSERPSFKPIDFSKV
ncbi:hypothetical protein PCE1_002493 [Barthelona sp. PCE]